MYLPASLRSSFLRALSAGAVLAALAAGCNVPVYLDVPVDTGDIVLNASQVTVPDALRDPSTMTLRTIPCMTDMMCPTIPGVMVAVRCTNNACDPDPIPVDVSTVVDISSAPDVRRFGSIARLTISRAEYTATSMGLQNAVGPTELRWGPEDAAAFDADGVQPFGTVPLVQLADTQPAQGDVTLDPAGAAALSDYLVHTSQRVKIFARPTIDLAPGGPLPAGQVTLRMRLTVRVEGQLVR